MVTSAIVCYRSAEMNEREGGKNRWGSREEWQKKIFPSLSSAPYPRLSFLSLAPLSARSCTLKAWIGLLGAGKQPQMNCSKEKLATKFMWKILAV